MGANKSKYTDSELAELAELPEFELSAGEKRAVTRWKKRMIGENTPVVPMERALEAAKEEVPEPSHALDAAKNMKWYGSEWPESCTVVLGNRGVKYGAEARALREFAGRIVRVDSGLTRRKAGDVRSHIASAMLTAFRPRGSYEARILEEDGSYSVLARYVGGAK